MSSSSPTPATSSRIARRPNLNSIIIQAQSPEMMPRIQQDVTDLLQQRRNGKEPDFTVRNQQELAEAATATTKTMTVLLGAIAGVSLVVGGIGIMNIMLVSVTERTREIGIRLAIGAHGRDVLTQFLVEAIILSVMGGTLGVALGVGASQIVSKLNNWPVLVSTSAIVIAVGFSALIGISSGSIPPARPPSSIRSRRCGMSEALGRGRPSSKELNGATATPPWRFAAARPIPGNCGSRYRLITTWLTAVVSPL
jgi:putative ABC transport system permease protein